MIFTARFIPSTTAPEVLATALDSKEPPRAEPFQMHHLIDPKEEARHRHRSAVAAAAAVGTLHRWLGGCRQSTCLGCCV